MAKIITDQEILNITTDIINNSRIDDQSDYCDFIQDLAEVITSYFGGDIGAVTHYPGDDLGVAVTVRQDENTPEDGGIWKDYDPEGEL